MMLPLRTAIVAGSAMLAAAGVFLSWRAARGVPRDLADVVAAARYRAIDGRVTGLPFAPRYRARSDREPQSQEELQMRAAAFRLLDSKTQMPAHDRATAMAIAGEIDKARV